MIDFDSLVIGPLIGIFGEPATFEPANDAAAFPITGVFDEANLELDLTGETAVTTQVPTIGVQLSQFPVPPLQDDRLVIVRTATRYIVKEVRVDSHGHARLMLNLDCEQP